MEKYYTPELSEFHIGFEFEVKERFFDGTVKTKADFDDALWVSQKCESGDFPYIERALLGKNAQNGLCGMRVKWLDRTDIEYLGWKANGSGGLFETLHIQRYDIISDKMCLGFIDPKHTKSYTLISFSDEIFEISVTEGQKIFHGNIKNKYAFRILMKQLGI